MKASGLIDPSHERVFCEAASHFQVFILVRAANPKAFRFYQQAGYYPKRLDVKAKTAKEDQGNYVLGGLVVNPHIHPGAFGGREMRGVLKNWEQSLNAIYIPSAGEKRVYLPAGKSYAVEMDRNHRHYGVLYYSKSGLLTQKLYVCGDYDLYGLISARNPQVHHFVIEKMLGNSHVRSPELRDVQFYLTRHLGQPLIQHGAQESYLEHQDEPVLVFEPGGAIRLLHNKSEIESYYQATLKGRQAFHSKHPELAKPGFGRWNQI
ncbi:hypothetical protein [Bryobacter aggregatus]|uniref:hypothetical protein n=1 Tax=Bryobacter aggregatus TaxID=360054 RepID=UPI0004E11946|nr:hypothetical protein [Bryobacter aggregatus]